MNRLITITLMLFFSLFMASYGPDAYAIQVGSSGAASQISYTANNMNYIGSQTEPIQIEYSETAGPWGKNVTIINQYSTITFMGEVLKASGSVPWTGWYEEILTPNWKFLNDGTNNISVFGLSNALTNLTITFASDGRSFQLGFDPIAPNPNAFWPIGLNINVPLSYIEPMSSPEYPTFEFIAYPIASAAAVPEPTTMLLLGSGLIGLWGLRKKFKK